MEHENDLMSIHSDHTPSDLLKVGLVCALGGGGVTAAVGIRFLVLGNTVQDRNAGIMCFVVCALMVVAGVWCQVKRARLLKKT